MIKRCIMIFPSFENIHVIDDIREKYDPLANHVRPHITLVFPFESNIEISELKQHLLSSLKNTSQFKIILNKITPTTSNGNYLFLNIKEGYDEIVKIHKWLYTGILSEFYPDWLKKVDFLPHMTVGNISSTKDFQNAVEETKNIDSIFETIVNEISVEIIDTNEDSIIEFSILLNNL